MGNPEKTENQAVRAKTPKPAITSCQYHPNATATPLRDRPANPDRKDPTEPRETQVPRAATVSQDLRDPLVHPDPQDAPANPARRARPATPEPNATEDPVRPDPQVVRAPQDPQAQLGHPARRAKTANRADPVPPATPELRALKASPEPQAALATMVLLAPQALAPTAHRLVWPLAIRKRGSISRDQAGRRPLVDRIAFKNSSFVSSRLISTSFTIISALLVQQRRKSDQSADSVFLIPPLF